MIYFVFSDLHSCIDELKKELMLKGYNEYDSNHKLLFLGDAFDKGVKHYETFKFIVESIKNNKLIWILGNHDYKYMENNSFLKRFETADEAKLFKDQGIYRKHVTTHSLDRTTDLQAAALCQAAHQARVLQRKFV